MTDAAEYKHVTVLFADVVRSMDMAAALGPERLRELMAELVDRAADVVNRYGGTLNQFTGDGIMALFGAPTSLEDHARRACLAALEILARARDLAAQVSDRDGVELRLRVGLNSGVVIAGDVGSAPIAYTATGQHVGMAQRMESVAPPGGAMLSEPTARLVDNDFVLGPPELLPIKGSDQPVPGRRLLSVIADRRMSRHTSRLVGRDSEIDTIGRVLHRALPGRGGVITICGQPGIGKTRLVREAAASAAARGFDVFTTYSESHTREVSFHVVARLFRAVFGIAELSAAQARIQIRSVLHAGDEDLVLLDELVGVRDHDVSVPDISPDARRRRLIGMITAASERRRHPALYVIEDAHWMDGVSESMLAEFAAAVSSTPSTILVTFRPEYQGTFRNYDGCEALTLSPLCHSDIDDLLGQLLGRDPSVGQIAAVIADRAAGIPFCAEEIVRDLAERGEIEGAPGAYRCQREIRDVHVPATLQAAIGARIDRLSPAAKRTLNAAAVIGARFNAGLLAALLEPIDLEPLIDAEFVDQIGSGSEAEYAFHHPLIQKVAYESQLMAARADLHRQVAARMEQAQAAHTGEGAALIATQYESAGELAQAYEWSMRAATYYGLRDIRAARESWEQAVRIADRLPDRHPECLAMRIQPRALLCGSAFQVGGVPEATGFDELQALAATAGDKESQALGMAGHLNTLTFNSRHREAAEAATEFAALVESIGEPTMTVGLLYGAAQAKWEAGQAVESLELAQRIVDLAGGDPKMGNFLIGSPLAWATTLTGVSKMFLGRKGWRAAIERGIAMARSFDATTRILAQVYKYAGATGNHAIVPDAQDISSTAESIRVAEQSGDNTAVTYSYMIRAMALLYSPAGNRTAGARALATAREMIVQEKLTVTLRRLTDLVAARELLRDADTDGAVESAARVLDEQFATEEMVFRGPATMVLVQGLLCRNCSGDLDAARVAIDRLAAVPTEPGFVMHELPILRCRALLARAAGDLAGYRQLVARYRRRAAECDFEGHLAEASALEAMN